MLWQQARGYRASTVEVKRRVHLESDALDLATLRLRPRSFLQLGLAHFIQDNSFQRLVHASCITGHVVGAQGVSDHTVRVRIAAHDEHSQGLRMRGFRFQATSPTTRGMWPIQCGR